MCIAQINVAMQGVRFLIQIDEHIDTIDRQRAAAILLRCVGVQGTSCRDANILELCVIHQ
jgi:hypothetical protein